MTDPMSSATATPSLSSRTVGGSRWLVGSLLAGVALALTGCGGDEEGSDDTAQAQEEACIKANEGNPEAQARCTPANAANTDPGGLVGEGDEGAMGITPLAPGEFATCATGGAAADLRPVAMLLVIDRSSSMNNNNKWVDATGAIVAFVQSPETAGLSVGLRFYPDDEPMQGCNQDDCSIDACAAPLVQSGLLNAESGAADVQEQNLVNAIQQRDAWVESMGTPTFAALGGGLEWARAYEAANPEQRGVVVLVTDGEPNGCNDNNSAIASLAGDANDDDGILTYAIGLEGSQEAQMNEIAEAGGTGDGIFIGGDGDPQAELLAALNAIRGEALDCEFPIPTPDDGMTIDRSLVNVVLSSGDGTDVQFTPVASAADCTADGNSWYYQADRIVLCESACNVALSDPQASVDLVFGCASGEPVIDEAR